MAFAAIAVHSVRIVTDVDEAVTTSAGVNEAVWARSQNGLILVVGAAIELVVVVAILLMRQGAILSFTVRLIVVQRRYGRLPRTLWPHTARNGLLRHGLVVVVIVC